VLTHPTRGFTGQFLIGEDVLRKVGFRGFSHPCRASGAKSLPDLFVE